MTKWLTNSMSYVLIKYSRNAVAAASFVRREAINGFENRVRGNITSPRMRITIRERQSRHEVVLA